MIESLTNPWVLVAFVLAWSAMLGARQSSFHKRLKKLEDRKVWETK